MEKENPKVPTANIALTNTNLLSQGEMDALKKDNHRAYMKMILSSKGSSTDRCSSFSTVTRGTNKPETMDEI